VAVDTVLVGGGYGPVRPTLGVHLRQLARKQDGRPAGLDTMRADVERDLMAARAAEVSAAQSIKLRAKYVVRIDADVTEWIGDRGLAARGVVSKASSRNSSMQASSWAPRSGVFRSSTIG